jgi:hypothetical protein
MKTKIVSTLLVSILLAFTSCKKEDVSKPHNTFTNNSTEGTADANGEFTLSGHISSEVSLAKVTLTSQGQTQPFFVDETTAKNKNEYDYTYLITGIVSNTTVIMDLYDQNGGKVTSQFLIKK